jgi:hypothetical protein
MNIFLFRNMEELLQVDLGPADPERGADLLPLEPALAALVSRRRQPRDAQ